MSYFWSIVKLMPLTVCVVTPVAIFICYGMAVGMEHVHPLLPYISDTGTKPPESCLFSVFLSSAAFVLSIVVYVRYRQVSEFMKLKSSSGITPLWNKLSCAFGCMSCLGLDLVACFQQSNQFTVHMIGAILCFFSGTAFFLTQTIFTRRMYPEQKRLFYFRAVFTALNLAFVIGIFVPVGIAFKQFHGKDVLKWSPEDGGYWPHIASTFSEWLLVFSFCVYMSTFHLDFSKIELLPPSVKFLKLEEGQEGRGTESAPRNVI